MGIVSFYIIIIALIYIFVASPINTFFKKSSAESYDKMRNRWVQSVTDSQLENELMDKIMDHNNYNSIYDRIEDFNRTHPEVYDFLNRNRSDEPYKGVGKTRLQTHAEISGNYYLNGINKSETIKLEMNRFAVLILLMATYYKFPMKIAKYIVSYENTLMPSSTELSAWINTPPWESGMYKKYNFK